MFTLQTLANLAEIVGGAAVVGGVIFAIWQIRQYREQAGGLLLVMWRKLHVWAEHVRDEQGYERWVEWWEWLAGQLQELEREGRAPRRRLSA